MKIRVADYIVNRLSEVGVDTVFMLNGGGMMHLVDALGRNPKMRYVCSHHEQASAMAADGYARKYGKLGVCFATSGPGATNILTGVVGAWQDSSPTLFITGQSKSTQTIAMSGIQGLRQFGTFEVDIVPIMRPITKYCEMVLDPKSIRYHLEKAMSFATTGRPGPVLLDIPLDIQGALVDPALLEPFLASDCKLEATSGQIDKLIELLANSKRPLLLAGAGIRAGNAVEIFRQLIDKLNIPVVTTQLGKDALYYEHPLFVGHPGPKGDRSGNFAIQTADLIISLGASLHGQSTGWENNLFAPDAIKVQIDLDDAVLAREKVNVNIKIRSGVAEFINAINKKIQPHGSLEWRACCNSWKQRYPVSLEAHETGTYGINFYRFIERISQLLPADACIVSDAGSAFYVTGQALRLKEGQRFLSSGSLGAMGYALPAANGASFAHSEGPVVCITGDGSLMTNIHDLATMHFYQTRVKLFVVNNDGYVSMRNTQSDFFGAPFIGADLSSGVYIPSIKLLAESYELPYFFCDEEQNLDSTISNVLGADGPVVCEIVGIRNQRIIPAVASKRMADGSMKSTPLHDMVPLLSEEIIANELNGAMNIGVSTCV